jgi:hypothetical protein
MDLKGTENEREDSCLLRCVTPCSLVEIYQFVCEVCCIALFMADTYQQSA